MKAFYGQIRSRLPDIDDRVRFSFEPSSGAVLLLTLKRGKFLPEAGQQVIVIGDLGPPGELYGYEVNAYGDLHNLNRQMRSDYRKSAD